jgi:hypothetical protein
LFKAIGQPKLGGTTDQSVRPNRDECFIFLYWKVLTMDKKLEPKVNIIDGQSAGKDFLLERKVPLQEQFIKQVKDDSLPADQVLTEQKEDRTPDYQAALFVP